MHISDVAHIINEWDPIGLFPMAPKDEYCKEIAEIYGYIELHDVIDVFDLATEINRVFLLAFGNDVFVCNEKECVEVSKKILELSKESKGSDVL